MDQIEPKYLEIRLRLDVSSPWGYSTALGLLLKGLRCISNHGGSRRVVAERIREKIDPSFTEAMLRDAEEGMGLSAERVAMLFTFYSDVLTEVRLRSGKDGRALIDVFTGRGRG